MAVMAVAAVSQQSLAQSQDEYCEYGSRTVLFLLDRTMIYDAKDRELISEGVNRILPRLQVGDRFVLQSITSDYVMGDRAFDRCMPGCPSGTSFFSKYLGQCNSVKASADKSRFNAALGDVFRGYLREIAEYGRSDIVRSISEVTRSIARNRGPETIRRDLGEVYVFSDLLENSEDFPWPTIIAKDPNGLVKEMDSMGLVPDFQGATISVFGYGRLHDRERTALNTITDRRLRDFWSMYFEIGEAGSYSIDNRFE